MMKKFACIALLFTMSLGMLAQSQKPTKEDLVGMWQLCAVFKDNVQYLPAFKEFTATNEFYTMRSFNRIEPAEVNNIGTYEITEEGKLLEHITLSTSNKALSGKDNTLTLEFNNTKTLMVVSYFDTMMDKTVVEFWKKIK